MKDFFAIGIGGTGMRCLTSLIHLCSMGMFDDTTVHILSIDTDKENGNLTELKGLIESYNTIRNSTVPTSNTFFSASIKYSQYTLDYSDQTSMNTILKSNETAQKSSKDVVNLMIPVSLQNEGLKEGFYGKPFMGSLLMYYDFENIVPQNSNTADLKVFLEDLNNCKDSKLFIFGSVFGGTGASAIPVLPRAIKAAAKAFGMQNFDLSKYQIGASLLTSYFSIEDAFADKTTAHSESSLFPLNSQIALNFYRKDETVNKTYDSFYVLGADTRVSLNPSQYASENIRGGSKQKNKAHFIELMAACAAVDFNEFGAKKGDGQPIPFFYKQLESDGFVTFKDYFQDEKLRNKFMSGFGSLIAYSILCNYEDYDMVENVRRKDRKNDNWSGIVGFDESTITNDSVDAIKKYFNQFLFKNDTKSTMCWSDSDANEDKGWLFQLHDTCNGYELKLFSENLKNLHAASDLKNFTWDKSIYLDEEHCFDGKTGLVMKSYDSNTRRQVFKDKMNKLTKTEDTSLFGLSRRTYETLKALYKF